MPSVSLKAIVLLHWTLSVWGCLTGSWVLPYSWSNFTVFAVGMWAIIDRQSVEALFMLMIMMLLTVVTDIILLSIFFPISNTSPSMRFCVGMVILNLIIKPFSVMLIYQMYKDRGGEYNINFGPRTPSYDQLDGQVAHDMSKQPVASAGAPSAADQGSSAYIKSPVASPFYGSS